MEIETNDVEMTIKRIRKNKATGTNNITLYPLDN